MRRLLYILLISVFLCGCKQKETLPPAFTEAPEEPAATSSEIQDLSKFQSLLSYDDTHQNWIPFALGSVFENPRDIDLEFMFYMGTERLGWFDISAESEQELIDAGFMREMDLQLMSVSSLEQALEATFGISLSDTTIPLSWYYLSSEDAYCSNNNDAYFVGNVIVTSATEYSDGTTEVHYQVDSYYNTKTGEFYDQTALILTLKQHHDRYLIQSNLIESVG